MTKTQVEGGNDMKGTQQMDGQSFNGYPGFVLIAEDRCQVLYDSDMNRVQQFLLNTAPSEVELFLLGYHAGFKTGQIQGKKELHRELHRLLGFPEGWDKEAGS